MENRSQVTRCPGARETDRRMNFFECPTVEFSLGTDIDSAARASHIERYLAADSQNDAEVALYVPLLCATTEFKGYEAK